MNAPDFNPALERQLLLQLGDRLKRLRKARGLGTVEMAAKAGISRNTLRAVESGDPGPSMGTYLRVMSVLGIGAELALLAGDWLAPTPAGSASAQTQQAAPLVQVRVMPDEARHRLQDLQSLALHEEAVRRAKADPAMVSQARAVLERWLENAQARSAPLWREWAEILAAGAWRKVLGRTRHAQQLRQASPLVTTLPPEVRQRILESVSEIKRGLVLGDGGNSV
jgi:transcriptional regulator with XRE-family HTH domain